MYIQKVYFQNLVKCLIVSVNDQVLLSGGEFEKRPPGANAWIFLKVEDNTKKPN